MMIIGRSYKQRKVLYPLEEKEGLETLKCYSVVAQMCYKTFLVSKSVVFVATGVVFHCQGCGIPLSRTWYSNFKGMILLCQECGISISRAQASIAMDFLLNFQGFHVPLSDAWYSIVKDMAFHLQKHGLPLQWMWYSIVKGVSSFFKSKVPLSSLFGRHS